jgi:hypothetical protein
MLLRGDRAREPIGGTSHCHPRPASLELSIAIARATYQDARVTLDRTNYACASKRSDRQQMLLENATRIHSGYRLDNLIDRNIHLLTIEVRSTGPE